VSWKVAIRRCFLGRDLHDRSDFSESILVKCGDEEIRARLSTAATRHVVLVESNRAAWIASRNC